MAAKVIKYPLTQAAKRGLAAQAATKQAEMGSNPDVQCVMMPNKLMVSTLDLCGPLSRVTVAFRAGPRNETDRNMGITHIIRSMAGFATQKYSAFAIIRNIQQNGIHFTCTGDREVTAFHVVAARPNINNALRYLSAVVSAPAFKPWQIMDNNPRVKYEIGCLTPQARTMDILHRVAFRTGLGNSLFVKKDHIESFNHNMLTTFYRESFTANRACVAGLNVDHDDIVKFAQNLELTESDPIQGNSQYFGGEIRKEKKSYFAHVAVATQGVGIKDLKEALIFSVLQYALGACPNIRWGGSPSPLYKATSPAAPDAGVSCFNINYSDTGLFGFFVTSSGETAGKAVESAFKVLKSGSVSDADVKRAKAQVKMNLLSSSEESGNLIEDIAVQSLHGGVIIPAPVLGEAIDKITASDVSNAAKKIAKGKMSLAAFGNLTNVPYLDQLR